MTISAGAGPSGPMVAAIVGAAGGIGRTTARALAKRGVTIAVITRAKDQAEMVAAEVRAASAKAVALQADASDSTALANVAQSLGREFGRLDSLIICAGAYAAAAVSELTDSEWNRLWRDNVLSAVLPVREFIELLRASGRASIVIVGSSAGQQGTAYQTAYNACKHAIVGYTRSLAIELAPAGFAVNAICPGPVDTALTWNDALPALARIRGETVEEALNRLLLRVPIGRLLAPEEVAEAIVWLATNPTPALTGQIIGVSGGLC
jgi:NAD(P)-dependent dehydrogenase (short-subunit alcohol dehydrogenase family)